MESMHWQHHTDEIHCPEWHQDCLAVVFTLTGCFSGKELKKLCRQADVKSAGDMEPVDCLEFLHRACHGSTEVVRAVEKSLADRFRGTMGKIRQADADTVEEMWADSDYPFPILWASLVDEREAVRMKSRRFLHEMVISAVGAMKQNDRSEGQADRIKSMSATIVDLQTEIRGLRRELKAKPKVIRDLASEAAARPAPAKAKKMTGLKLEIKRLRDLVSEKDVTIAQLEQQVLHQKALRIPQEHLLKVPVQQTSRGWEADEGSAPDWATGHCGAADCPSNCQGSHWPDPSACRDCPLEGRRILVIGGLERMETTYREVVHQMGGVLCYHGGHVKSNSKKLKNMVARADGAIFITSVNSHAAQSVVKETCKKAGTPLLILRETGVGSLEKALRGMAA